MSLERPCIHWSDGYCKKFSDDEVESWCVDGPCEYEQQSNADRIRAMSDEELADWVARTQIANVAEALSIANIPWHQTDGIYDETKKECLEWLQQPAEG